MEIKILVNEVLKLGAKSKLSLENCNLHIFYNCVRQSNNDFVLRVVIPANPDIKLTNGLTLKDAVSQTERPDPYTRSFEKYFVFRSRPEYVIAPLDTENSDIKYNNILRDALASCITNDREK